MAHVTENLVMNYKIQQNQKAKICILSLGGYLDFVTIPQLEKTIEDIKSKKIFNLVVNLKNVDLVTSSGWGLFIGTLQDFQKENGDIRFTEMKPTIDEVFHTLELGTFFYHFRDLDEAIRSFDTVSGSKLSQNLKSKTATSVKGQETKKGRNDTIYKIIIKLQYEKKKLQKKNNDLKTSNEYLMSENEEIISKLKDLLMRRPTKEFLMDRIQHIIDEYSEFSIKENSMQLGKL